MRVRSNVEQAREKLATDTLALCDIHVAGESGLVLAEEILGTALSLRRFAPPRPDWEEGLGGPITGSDKRR